MTIFYTDDSVTLHHGDALEVLRELPAGSVDCIVTSPPYYGLRDYGTEGQYGLEESPAAYVETMRGLFAEARRVLADDGTLWLNLGSSYMNGSSPGPQGKTSQRAGRTFTANDGVEVRRDAQPNGKPYTAQSGSTGLDSSCSGLCDGCEAAQSHRNADTHPPLPESVQHREQTTRGNAHLGSSPTSPDAEPLGVRESTTPLSSQPLPAVCSHCGNCGVCLEVLRSSSRDARLCARREQYTNDTSQHGSEFRSQGTDASGMAWLNYTARLTPKSLIPIPWMVAMSLQDDGWILRNDIIWAKPNAMPESVTDRLATKHEHLFLFSKNRRYWFDLDPIREPHMAPAAGGLFKRDESSYVAQASGKQGNWDGEYNAAGKNPGDVWNIPTQPYPGAHFAVMPMQLASRAIQAGCKPTRASCDCDDIVATPANKGGQRASDPTPTSGRRGMNRERINGEGVRPITKREQRGHAEQLRHHEHRAEIEALAGSAFAHYIRTDASGARPLPPDLLADLTARGWLAPVPSCTHPPGGPGVVLDPFSGSGTTGLAAAKHGRKYVGIDLNADYLELSLRTRLAQAALLDEEPA